MILNVRAVVNEVNCDDESGRCDDYHEGLCMAHLPGFPKKITRMRKCPYGEVEDVLR